MKLHFNKITVLLATLIAFSVTAFTFPQSSLAATCGDEQVYVSKTITYQGTTPTIHLKIKTQNVDKKVTLAQHKNNHIKLVVSNKSTNKLHKQVPNKKIVTKKPVATSKQAAQVTKQSAPKKVIQPAPKTAQPTTQIGNFQQQVVDLVNKERVKQGLSPLKIKQDLTNMAQMKAQDMTNKKYFAHNSPTYGSPFDMMRKFGIGYLAAGENIAMGQKTPDQVVQDWMNSPGHRANILNPNFTEIGVGISNSYNGYGYIWVQAFCKR